MKTKKFWLSDMINVLSAISFFAIIVAILINSKKYARCGADINIPMMLIFFLVICIFFFVCYKLFSSIKKTALYFISCFALLFVFQLAFSYLTYTAIGWDVQPIINHASRVSLSDQYFLMYPNNTLLCFIFRAWFSIFKAIGITSFWFEAIVLNIIIMDLTIWLVCLSAKKLFGQKAFVFAFILSTLAIGLSPYMTVPYSDTIGMLFMVLCLYLTIGLIQGKKPYIQFSLLVIVMLLGYRIKPTVIIVGLVCLLFLLIYTLKTKDNIGGLNVGLLFLSLIFSIAFFFAIDIVSKNVVLEKTYTKQQTDDYAVPLTHYAMMGLNESVITADTFSYGSYSQADANATFDISGKDQKVAYHISEINKRYRKIGFSGFMKHIGNKFIWVSTDGSFYYGGEGGFHAGAQISESGLRARLQNFTFIKSEGYQKYYINYLQALWLLIVTLCFLASFIKKQSTELDFFKPIAQLSILGCFVFLMLFEARPRYVLIFMPIFILLTTYAWHGLSRLTTRKAKSNNV
jgi:hypothetical protein